MNAVTVTDRKTVEIFMVA